MSERKDSTKFLAEQIRLERANRQNGINPVQRASPSDLLTTALAYAKAGLYVIPLHEPILNATGECIGCTCGNNHLTPKGEPDTSRGKHPRIDQWRELASNDPEQIRAWWEEWPTANIGIAAGKSDLLILDLDKYKKEYKGADLLTTGEQETVTGQSGGGGEHLYYRMPKGKFYGNKTKGLPPGIDIRGWGGFVVAPPSLHYSGTRYAWKTGCSPLEREPAELPAKLIAILDGAQESKTKPVHFTGNGSTPIPDLSLLRLWAKEQLQIGWQAEDRSKNDYGVTCEMIRAGYTDDQIKWVFDTYPIGTKGKYAEKDEKYLTDMIAKARAEVESQLTKKKWFEPTELGNAERLADAHGDTIRCVFLKEKKKRWHVWDGKQWKVDEGEMLIRKAKATVRGMYREAAEIKDDDARNAFVKYIRSCESKQKLYSMIDLAGAEEGITAYPDDFDPDPYLLNCENGILDLRTGELKPHDSSYMCSRLAVAYDPSCPTPLWDAFLKRFFGEKPDIANFLQRFGGYTLTGKATEKNFIIEHGASGNNGKSTFLGALRGCLRDYAYAIKLDVLTAVSHNAGGDAATPSLLAMQNCRLLTSDEIPEGWRPNVSLLKNITNGAIEPINVRGLFLTSASYMPTMKLWLFGNPVPKLPSEDDGIWKRALLVPFTYQIPDSEVDTEFAYKLQAELPGILAWFAKGTREWLARGLSIPQSIRTATKEYRDEMDLVQRFISEVCFVGPDERIQTDKLYQAWEAWRKGKGQELTKNKFSRKLTNLGYETMESDSKSYKTGLTLNQLSLDLDAAKAQATRR